MAWCKAASAGDNLSDSASLFLNNDHLSSLTVLIVAFGSHSWRTNCSMPSRVSSSGFSSLPRLAKDLRIDSMARLQILSSKSVSFAEKLHVLSVPGKAWNAGSAAVLADSSASTVDQRTSLNSTSKPALKHQLIGVWRIDRKFCSNVSYSPRL